MHPEHCKNDNYRCGLEMVFDTVVRCIQNTARMTNYRFGLEMVFDSVVYYYNVILR